MPKEIYNEGRVVGYSAYEEYLKHTLSENPSQTPATEREWLASTLGNGTSMLLKVPSDIYTERAHYVDFPLPENSVLSSANVIIGNLFLGQAEVDEHGWATKVTDYGQGIFNLSNIHPSDTEDATEYDPQAMKCWVNDLGTHQEPFKDHPEYTYTVNDGFENEVISLDNEDNQSIPAKELMQYMKIQDGIVLQPGEWLETESGNPYMDIHPNLTETSVVRLVFSTNITSEFYILLTGFTDRNVLSGISGLDNQSNSNSPQNGDFLGPAAYPWATKITFIYPPAAEYYIRRTMYSKYPNLKINLGDYEDKIGTEFVSSHMIADKGVSICGPSEPGGDILISSRIKNDSNNYIKVTQDSLNIEKCTKYGDIDNKNHQTDEHFTTSIQHGEIHIGDGIAFRPPDSPGDDIYISSKIKSTNNLVKVEQRRIAKLPHNEWDSNHDDIGTIDNPNDSKYENYTNRDNGQLDETATSVTDESTTKLTISEVVRAIGRASGVKIDQPTTPGGDIQIQNNIRVRSTIDDEEHKRLWYNENKNNGLDDSTSRSDNAIPFNQYNYNNDNSHIVSFNPYMMVVQEHDKTILVPAQFTESNGITVKCEQFNTTTNSFPDLDKVLNKPNGWVALAPTIELGIDLDKLVGIKIPTDKPNETVDMSLRDLLDKIITRLGGMQWYIDNDNNKFIDWTIPGAAAIGNMNVFSGPENTELPYHYPHFLVSENPTVHEGDLRVR